MPLIAKARHSLLGHLDLVGEYSNLSLVLGAIIKWIVSPSCDHTASLKVIKTLDRRQNLVLTEYCPLLATACSRAFLEMLGLVFLRAAQGWGRIRHSKQ